VHYSQHHRHFLSLRTAQASQHFSISVPGPAPLNLEIPPYVFMTDTKVKSTVLIDALAAAFSRRKKLTRFQVKIG
jgi:Rieske Fe-S protein